LQAGDKPPGGGIEYWVEGHRPRPKTEEPPPAADSKLSPAPAWSARPAEPTPVDKPTEIRLATDEEKTECIAYLKKNHGYKDPESVRIEGESQTAVYANGDRRVVILVNAKNSFGAYAGTKPTVCYYNDAGVLKKSNNSVFVTPSGTLLFF
jgi:hypothetical protein